MAQNPMQRKMTNAFLLGMLVTLLIAAVIVMILINQLKTAKEEKNKLSEENGSLYATVYVTTEKVPADQIVFGTDEGSKKITETVVPVPPEFNMGGTSSEDLVTKTDLYYPDPQTNEIDEFNSTPKILAAAIEIPAGTILTRGMIKDSSVDSSERLMEYNMISLPSQLTENSYVDIRLLLPSGDDFVVVSKKFVTQANATTIWMKMTESEIESLSNAIIDSYIVAGSKLYASVYSSPVSQTKSIVTYIPSQNVRDVMKVMLGEAKFMELSREGNWSNNAANVRNRIRAYYGEAEEQKDAAAEGIETEKTNLQSAREAFLETMGY